MCLVDLIVGMLRRINSDYSDRTAGLVYGCVIKGVRHEIKQHSYSGCVVLLCQLSILQWYVSSCVAVTE